MFHFMHCVVSEAYKTQKPHLYGVCVWVQTQRVPPCQSLIRLTIPLARNGICTGPNGWPITKVATAPPTCHMMQLITRHHHMIQVSTCDSHASQRGPTPATCGGSPVHSIMCVYLLGRAAGAISWTQIQDYNRPYWRNPTRAPPVPQISYKSGRELGGIGSA